MSLEPMTGLIGPNGEAAQIQAYEVTGPKPMPEDIAKVLLPCLLCGAPFSHARGARSLAIFAIMRNDEQIDAEWVYVCAQCPVTSRRAQEAIGDYYFDKGYQRIVDGMHRA